MKNPLSRRHRKRKAKERAQRTEEKRYHQIRRRIINVVIWFGIGIAIGTLGYYLLYDGDQEITLVRCMFMSIITMSTVGYGEVIPVTGNLTLEVFTGFIILFGIALTAYFTSVVTAFIVSGELLFIWRTNRMRKQVEGLSNHFIIAGIGQVGFHVADELLLSKRSIVLIDRSLERIEAFLSHYGGEIPFIQGDATDDDVLIDAGIENADGIIFTLDNDHENLFATITARTLNANVRIISRGQDEGSSQKFYRAGANKVIFANVIGAMRMASETLRPSVVGFLDVMLKDREHPRRVEELFVPENSKVIGKRLRDLNIRSCTDALVLAVEKPSTPLQQQQHQLHLQQMQQLLQQAQQIPQFDFNPGPDYLIEARSKLVVIALVEDLPLLRALVRGETPPKRSRKG
jgi:voltage-gated potassium channel